MDCRSDVGEAAVCQRRGPARRALCHDAIRAGGAADAQEFRQAGRADALRIHVEAVDAGHPEAVGVLLVSLIGLGSLIGRFGIGTVADRVGRMLSGWRSDSGEGSAT